MSREPKKLIQRKDLRGTLIEVGSRVAFNYSGNVASGVVEKLTASEIHILRDTDYYGSNPISKIKNASGVLVIYEGSTRDEINRLNKLTLEIDRERAAAIRKQVWAETRSNAVCEKLTQLIVCISDAYSVDEIQLLVEDLFGRDALDETFRDETIERALNG